MKNSERRSNDRRKGQPSDDGEGTEAIGCGQEHSAWMVEALSHLVANQDCVSDKKIRGRRHLPPSLIKNKI